MPPMLLMRLGESSEMQVEVWVNAAELSAASFEPDLLIRCHH